MTQCATNEVKISNIDNKSQWELVFHDKIIVGNEYKTINWVRIKVIDRKENTVMYNPRVIWEWYSNKRYSIESPLLFTI